MIVCPNCGRENEDHYKYCLGCGTVLPQAEEAKPAQEEVKMISCPHCGAQVPSNFKFCGACGGAIAADAQPSVAEATSLQEAPPEPQPQGGAAPETQPQEAVVANLVVIKPDGSEGARIPVPGGEIVLGRSSEHEVLSGDPFLSPQHATLSTNGDGSFTVTDHNSLNGVFVRIRGERELRDGDYIRIGQELLHFQLMDSVQPLVAKANETLTGGSPNTGYWGRLSLVSGPDLESRGFIFNQDEVAIGREVGDILFRDDGFVSGKHVRVAKIEDKVFIKDLGSSNGTYIRIRGQHQISEGDLILMGQQLFKLSV